VVIDPAHGGPDTGARGSANILESELVLAFAQAVRPPLQALGMRILMTREGNQNPSFDSRSLLVNGLTGAIFISLHVGSTGPAGTAQTYWYEFPAPDLVSTAAQRSRPGVPMSRPRLIEWDRAQEPHQAASRRLAELIQLQLARTFGGSLQTPQSAPVRQLRTIAAPAVAVEISSLAPADRRTLEGMAPALAQAISKAMEELRSSGTGPGASSGER
jgi:N-acetylmuramoyl-L-alanine amidase